MTPRTRRSGGQSKSADDQAKAEVEETKTEAQENTEENQGESPDATSKDAEQPAEQPDGASGDADQTRQPAPIGEDGKADVLLVDGDPVPAEVEQSMVRPETGLSPEVPADTDEPVATAPTGDTERNGKATAIPVDTSGELRHVDGAVPTAAYGQSAENGHATGMAAEGQLTTDFGGNGDSAAKLVGSGVRGEAGVGTLDPDIGDDERPQYPSTTLTRESPEAAPMEPEDVKYATQPKLGDVNGSTDPLMAAAAMPSMPGDQTERLIGSGGNEVKPSDFFEVPDGIQGRTLMRVNQRVSREFTIRKVTTPNRQLLFTEGQLVPVEVAETLIRLHG